MLVQSVYSCVELAASTAWDYAMAMVLLRSANVPVHNSWAAVRISGPGMSSNYFYKVPRSVVINALRSCLEQEELELFKSLEQSRICSSLIVVQSFLESIAKPYGLIVPAQSEATNEPVDYVAWKKAETDGIELLTKEINGRREWLSQFIELPPHAFGRVKQSSETLQSILAEAESVAADFYAHRLIELIVQANNIGIEAYWHAKNLEVGDSAGLARRMLAGVFGKALLDPLESTDCSFSVSDGEERLGTVLAGFFSSL
jgi:hypothetical protein